MENLKLYEKVITLKGFLEDNTNQPSKALKEAEAHLDAVFEVLERRRK